MKSLTVSCQYIYDYVIHRLCNCSANTALQTFSCPATTNGWKKQQIQPKNKSFHERPAMASGMAQLIIPKVPCQSADAWHRLLSDWRARPQHYMRPHQRSRKNETSDQISLSIPSVPRYGTIMLYYKRTKSFDT